MKRNKGLRICYIGMKHVPSREGGIEVAVTEMAARMAVLGYEITCYNRGNLRTNDVTVEKNRGDQNIRIKYVPTIPYGGLAAVSSSFCGAVCAALGNYDIIHFHAEGPAFMCWLPKLFGKKVVVTIHGLDYQRVKWGAIASFYIKLGEKNAARFADEVIVLSEHMKEYFRTAYGRETHFIPNGVNRPVLRDAKLIKEKYELEKDGYILFLGRIVPEKGLQRLLRTFKEVKTGRKLVIAGGSADTDRKFWNELRETAREDPRILFTGFVQGQLLDELYSNAYFCVFPSDLEGMSLSLLEAMSYGNSCVVSDIPEFVEVVEDYALIFQRAGADDFRRKMQMLCDDEALVKCYREGVSDFICKKYKWDDVVVETLRLYRKVLGLRL